MPPTVNCQLSTVNRPAALPYHSTASVWLSVDPLSDKYPGVSPYVYCAGNPVVIKDPNGEDYELVVDNEKKTITIRANYIVCGSETEYQQTKDAVDLWNKQSGVYALKTDNSEYTVNFDLSIVRVTDDNLLKKTEYIDNTICFVNQLQSKNINAKGEAIANSDGGMSRIQILKESCCKQFIMHEIGHTLGLNHSTGLMYYNGFYNNEDIYIHHVGGILNYAGLNVMIGKDDALKFGPNASIHGSDQLKGDLIWKSK